MGQALKVCTGGDSDTARSHTGRRSISKDDSKATAGGAPKLIYCQHPSNLQDPVLSYWGQNEFKTSFEIFLQFSCFDFNRNLN